MSSINGTRRLLIVTTDPAIQSQLRERMEHYDVRVAKDRASALVQARSHEPGVVVQDLDLRPKTLGEGLAALAEIRAAVPYAKIIAITANNDHQIAVRAAGLGVWDLCHKSTINEVVPLIVRRAYGMYELEQQNRRPSLSDHTAPLEGVITTEEHMLQICRLIRKAAPTDASVLLLGETGTGKELLARAIHSLSPRAEADFSLVDCAVASPETLETNGLFGTRKRADHDALAGAATVGGGANASAGTLFLDEIGKASVALQAYLARFLRQHHLQHAGVSSRPGTRLRLICASSQDLTELIKQGRFRKDLYHRISELTVKIPPLRERGGDVIELARTFLVKYARQHHRPLRGFTPDAVQAIEAYTWPGNVRELENKINGAVILAEGSHVTAKDLDLHAPALSFDLRQIRQQAERRAIMRALSIDHGNISRAAGLLGISRPTLYDLMHKYGLR